MASEYRLKNGWIRRTDGGWLQGLPSYERGEYYIAQDYDDLDTGSQKLMWFVHNEEGFLHAYDTLAEAMESAPDPKWEDHKEDADLASEGRDRYGSLSDR